MVLDSNSAWSVANLTISSAGTRVEEIKLFIIHKQELRSSLKYSSDYAVPLNLLTLQY